MTTTTTERTYSITLKGEQHTWGPFAPWDTLSWQDVCTILSDLTGYKAEFLTRELPGKFDHLGYCEVRPAACSFGETPAFWLRSNDGGKPNDNAR